MKFSLKRVREDPDLTVTSQSMSPLKTRQRRLSKRYLDFGSDDEKNLFQAIRNKPWLSYHSESSSEDESDLEKMSPARKSSSLPIGVVRGCTSCEGCQKVLARWRPEAGCRPALEEAPVFFPLEEEFQDTVKYIASIAAEAAPYGICRIVPPHSWRPPCPLKDSDKRRTTKFPTRVQRLDKLQVREAHVKKEQRKRRRGRPPLNCDNICSDSSDEEKFGFEPGPSFTLETFENYAKKFKDEYFGLRDRNELHNDSSKNEPSVECIEGEYWRIVEHATEQLEVLYGADIETGKFGSGFPKAKLGVTSSSYETSGWNLNNIARIGGSVLSFEEEEISGVLVPWLYVGMCLSSFCWHVEDHHFYSLNYMHFGSPKVWYGVPGSAAHKFEDAMKSHLPDLFEEQPDLLHKLVTQLSPSVLKADGVPVYRAVQKPGEFVVTFPRAYHAGFNCGFNCAEAVNVAPIDWLPAGQNAVELYRQQKRKSTVSHDKLLLGAAQKYLSIKNQQSSLTGDANSVVWKELFAHYKVLSNVFKDRVDLERSLRRKVEDFVNIRQMDRNFDSTDAKECLVCHYDLHLSAIGCECAQERYTCLEHVHELCCCDKSRKHALYRYEISDLDAIVAALEGTFESGNSVNKLLELFIGSETSKVNSTQVKQEDPTIEQSGSSSSVAGSNPASFGPYPAGLGESSAATKACALTDSIWNGGFNAMSAFLLKDFENFELLLAGSKNPDVHSSRNQVRSAELSNPAALVHPNSRQGNISPFSCVKGPAEEKVKIEVIVLSDDDEDSPDSQSVSNPLCPMNTTDAVTKRPFIGKRFEECPLPISLPGSQCISNPSSAVNPAHAIDKKLNIVEELKASSEVLLPLRQKPVMQPAWNTFGSESILQVHSDRPMVTSAGDSGVLASTSQETKPVSFSSCFYTNFGDSSRGAASNKDWLCLGHRQTPSIDQQHHNLLSTGLSFDHSRFEGKDLVKHAFLSATEDPLGSSLHHCLPQHQEVKVDLLHVGRLVLGMSWCNKHAIFPAGFRSRILFTSFLDPCKMCSYTSEILDYGHAGPLFKVTMDEHPNEVFVHGCIDKCWQMVQERVNIVIQLHHSFGKMGLPPLRSPEDIRGLELFGFTSPHIIKAVESLDWRRQCLEYWTGRMSAVGLLQTQHQAQVASVIGPEYLLSRHQSRTLLERAAPLGFNTMAMHNLWQ